MLFWFRKGSHNGSTKQWPSMLKCCHCLLYLLHFDCNEKHTFALAHTHNSRSSSVSSSLPSLPPPVYTCRRPRSLAVIKRAGRYGMGIMSGLKALCLKMKPEADDKTQ